MAAAYEPPVTDDRGPLVIRPSWQAIGWWQMALYAIVGSGLLSGSFTLFGKSERLSWFAAFIASCGLVLVGYALYQTAYAARTRITVTADTILVRHWFRVARVRCSDIARVVRCSVRPLQTGHGPRPPSPVVFAFSASGRCVLSLYADRWSQDDLDRIWRRLGIVPEGSWTDIIDDIDLDSTFPRAF